MSVPRSALLLHVGANALLRYGTLSRRTSEADVAVEMFTRASVASYVGRDGVLRSAAAGAPRLSWVDGLPTLLLEAARTNLLLHSEAFDNAVWTKSVQITVTPDQITAPDGTTSADRIVNSGGAAFQAITQTITVSAVADRYAIMCAFRAGGYTDVAFGILDATSWPAQAGRIISGPGSVSGVGPINIGGLSVDEWTIVEVVLGANATAGHEIKWVAYPGGTNNTDAGDMYYWGAGGERGATASSYIKTTTAAVARALDSLHFPFAAAPRAMTVYARWIEQTGTASAAGVWGLGAWAGESLLLYRPSSNYTLTRGPDADRLDVNVAGPPTPGQLVEARALLYADGSIQLGIAKDGAAESLSSQSAARPLAAAWSAPEFRLGRYSSGSEGFAAFRTAMIAPGIRTLDAFRRIPGAV